MYLFKGKVLEIDNHEFFVKYSRPFFGQVNNQMAIKIESSLPQSIQVLKLAPIWNDKSDLDRIL